MNSQRIIIAFAALAPLAAAASCRSAAPREAPPPPEEEQAPGAGGAPEATAPAEPVAYELLQRGTDAGLAALELSVLRSGEAWDEAWRRLTAGRFEAPPPPAVDFDQRMLVLVALGERPTAGYDVRIQAVERRGDTLRIHATEKRPAPDSVQAQVITSPYVVLSLPRHAGPLVFVVE